MARRGARLLLSVSFGLGALLAPVAAQAAGAPGTPAVGTAAERALMQAQAPLDAAAARVLSAAAGDRASGLAGVRVSPEARTVTIYWHGALPQGAQQAVTLERSAGSTITVVPAAYSHGLLRDAAVRLAQAAPAGHLAGSPARITMIYPREDGSGLDVGVDGPAAAAAAAVRQALSATGGSVPVNIVQRPATVTTLREDDFPPYWGGAWIKDSDGNCTTGYAAHDGSGHQYIIAASHCAPNGSGTKIYNGAGNFEGTVGAWQTNHDSMAVSVSQSQGRIYDGPQIYACCQFSKPVVGWNNPYTGDYVCISGAYSGTRCSIRIGATGLANLESNSDGDWSHWVFDEADLEQTSHKDATGGGDSGAPVFSLASNPGQVIARGIASGVDLSTTTACVGITNRTCYWRAYAPDIMYVQWDLGVSLTFG